MINASGRASVRARYLLTGTALTLLSTAPALAQVSTQGPPPPTASAGPTTEPVANGVAVETQGDSPNSAASNQPNDVANTGGSAVGDIVVTGSRIVRDGYTAPTPVTVVSAEQLQVNQPGAIPQALNQLPQFGGGRNNNTVGGSGATPSGGNYLALRSLGSLRTLTLLDGQRLPPTDASGAVDANIIPQALISRVDVVTGGASAAYGSDAVSGVVNFILDTKFNGLKGLGQAGISEYGDSDSYKFNLAGGFNVTPSIHVLFSYDHYEVQALRDTLENRHAGRPGGELDLLRVGAGTAANPYRELPDIRYVRGTWGTVVDLQQNPANHPLRGFQFGPNSTLIPFNPGTPTGTTFFNQGGDGSISFGKTLTGGQNTDQGFGRVDIDLGGDTSAFVQASYADSYNNLVTIGSGTQIGDFRIFADNAFLPTVARDLLNAGGAPSFVAGRIQADQPPKEAQFSTAALTLVTGLRGKIAGYNWRVGYSRGDSKIKAAHAGNFDNSRWFAALDAVRGPNGNIVCRITLTNPGLQDNCVPINIFGNGSPSVAAYDYVSQTSRYTINNTIDIFSGDVSGDLFSLPAGPVSFALGGEYRKAKLDQRSSTDPTKSIDFTGLRTFVTPFVLQYNSTNVGRAFGTNQVKEAFVELAVPVLKDSAVGSLDLNGAARVTDYANSGTVVTWKVGASYNPIPDIRSRATLSRDIRAPSLNELFAGPTAARSQFNDRLTGINNNVINYSQGNPELTPEIADTFTAGVGYQPSWFSGLSLSIDYYRIKIKDAIGTLGLDTVQTECEASNGTSDVCNLIARPFPYSNRTPANFPTATYAVPFNQAFSKLSGIDYEISYRTSFPGMFDNATLNLRLIGNHIIDNTNQNSATARVTRSRNVGSNLRNRFNVQVNYDDGPIGINGQLRYLGAAKKTQDPLLFYEVNDIPSRVYVDTTLQYKLPIAGVNLEAYITINNLFDRKPPIFTTSTQPGQNYPTNAAVYDVIGRYYTGGMRFRF